MAGREIEFHPGLGDVADYALRLVQKAHARGLRVVLTGAPEMLGRIDSLLWTFEPGAFLPHARLRAGEAVSAAMARTPVWLADDPRAAGPADVLVNLGPHMPVFDGGNGRTLELVGSAEAAAAAGRQRWQQYKAQGDVPCDVRQRAAATRAEARGATNDAAD